MSNKVVYKKTDEIPISLTILSARWKLFGHILRLPHDTQAQMSMQHYFTPSTKPKFRGRPRTTLPLTLSQDITRAAAYNKDFYSNYQLRDLKSTTDLKKLLNIANDRKNWKILAKQIYDAAEVETLY